VTYYRLASERALTAAAFGSIRNGINDVKQRMYDTLSRIFADIVGDRNRALECYQEAIKRKSESGDPAEIEQSIFRLIIDGLLVKDSRHTAVEYIQQFKLVAATPEDLYLECVQEHLTMLGTPRAGAAITSI
jgi:hypothetical protein